MAAKPAADIDEYIASMPAEGAKVWLSRVRAIVREEVPESVETISYGMPTFDLGGKFFWFGGFKKHCSIFGARTDGPFAERLKGYKISKGTIQFPFSEPFPEELVRDIVRARVAEHLAL